MAKSTENRAFRTVDVDLYNEDNYKEEADTEVSTEALDFVYVLILDSLKVFYEKLKNQNRFSEGFKLHIYF